MNKNQFAIFIGLIIFYVIFMVYDILYLVLSTQLIIIMLLISTQKGDNDGLSKIQETNGRKEEKEPSEIGFQ